MRPEHKSWPRLPPIPFFHKVLPFCVHINASTLIIAIAKRQHQTLPTHIVRLMPRREIPVGARGSETPLSGLAHARCKCSEKTPPGTFKKRGSTGSMCSSGSIQPNKKSPARKGTKRCEHSTTDVQFVESHQLHCNRDQCKRSFV